MTNQPRHEPGPDFNRKVAEALGWEALGGWVYRNGELYRKGWSPSADDRTACKDIEEELLRRGFAVNSLVSQDSAVVGIRRADEWSDLILVESTTYGHALCLVVLALAKAAKEKT